MCLYHPLKGDELTFLVRSLPLILPPWKILQASFRNGCYARCLYFFPTHSDAGNKDASEIMCGRQHSGRQHCISIMNQIIEASGHGKQPVK